MHNMSSDCFIRPATVVGEELLVDEIYGQLMPEGKVELVNKFQKMGYFVGMVGDGKDIPFLFNIDKESTMHLPWRLPMWGLEWAADLIQP